MEIFICLKSKSKSNHQKSGCMNYGLNPHFSLIVTFELTKKNILNHQKRIQ